MRSAPARLSGQVISPPQVIQAASGVGKPLAILALIVCAIPLLKVLIPALIMMFLPIALVFFFFGRFLGPLSLDDAAHRWRRPAAAAGPARTRCCSGSMTGAGAIVPVQLRSHQSGVELGDRVTRRRPARRRPRARGTRREPHDRAAPVLPRRDRGGAVRAGCVVLIVLGSLL